LAIIYNNQGFSELQNGNLTIAQRKFQRAVALNPDLVVPYHNVAEVYQQINRLEEAKNWYQKAIERDLDFAPPYRGLGHLYNLQGEHEEAKAILLAGLSHFETQVKDGYGEKAYQVTHYKLLSELGWAYFALDQVDLAQAALEQAIDLEAQIERLEEVEGTQYRQALPHYYLAQIYERLDRPDEAYEQWETCLRLLEPGWGSEAKRTVVLSHIEALEAEQQ
jgi:tetratricopeptide (TPR) repeat protein